MVVFFFIKLQTCAADLSNIQLEDLSKPKLCCVCVCVCLSLSEVSRNFPTNKKLSINHWEASPVCLLYCCLKLSFNLLLIMCGKIFWISESKSVDPIDSRSTDGFWFLLSGEVCRWAASGGSLDFQTSCLVVGVLVEEEDQKSFTTSFSCKCQEQLSAAPQSSTDSLCVLFSLDSKVRFFNHSSRNCTWKNYVLRSDS